MNIKRLTGPSGTKSILTYWYQGIRYRPTIGYNLTPDQEREKALSFIQQVHGQLHQTSATAGPTFAAFVPHYLQRMRTRKRVTIDWTKRYVIDAQLVPFFGPMRLQEIRLSHAEQYVEHRRSKGAADGTIERECNVLSAFMNLAVEHEYIERNRLRTMPTPKGDRRKRTATPEELQILLDQANPPLARAIVVAINTGLREGKIVEIDQGWIKPFEDGPWMLLPAARTTTKGNPEKMPLNRHAAHAITTDITYLHGKRAFDNWTNGQGLSHAFTKLTSRCGIQGLTFHDLRHTFATTLENLEVGERTIDLLMGHKIPDTGERYRHGGPGRDKKMRDAVTALEQHWHQVPLQVPLEQTPTKAATRNRK